MPKPDFFIVGAPKCGTTALNDYLAAHPEIFMCPRKESHHFCADWSPSYLADRAAYLQLFDSAQDARRIGEASVWYLYAAHAAHALHTFNPHAQIIIMLRQPVDMIYSLHGHRLYIGSEDCHDFATALALEPARRKALQLPPWPYPVEGLFYRDVMRYVQRVERYFTTFGRDRVRVILYDDFRRDTARVFRETCAWLGVADNWLPDLRVINAAKKVRNYRLRNFLDSPPAWLRRIGGPLTPRAWRHAFFKQIRSWNTAHVPRPPLDDNLRRTLQAEISPEIERLSQLFDRDLRQWQQGNDE